MKLEENPLQEFRAEIEVRTGDSWFMSSMGVDDGVPEIELRVLGPRVVNPTLTNLSTARTG